MSAARAYKTQQNGNFAQGLRLLSSQSVTRRRVAKVLVFGTIATVLTGLLLNVMIAQSAYEMANLKNRTKELTTTSQVLQQQVGSLASNQNLEQAAHDMGMVANTNPVFLNIQNQQVFGKPMRAAYSNSLANNLVANAVLTDQTNVKLLVSAKAKADAIAASNLVAAVKSSTSKAMNVAAAKPTAKKVSLPSSGIPGSPTH